jgi:hypothetical protein
MQNQVEKKEFRGQGTLNYVSYNHFEYYTSGIDQILELRLDNTNAVLLKSRHFGKEMRLTAEKLAYDAMSVLAYDNTQTVLVPVNLYNKHWIGLLFKRLENVIEVTYMDPEQRVMVPRLKYELERHFAMNGCENRFLEARLEKQSYNNCGLEVIENFVYYLTGARATQEGAVYVHSLLVEDSLLDPKEYRLKIAENNKLIEFLSNAAPLSIQSLDFYPTTKTPTIRHCEERSFVAIHLSRVAECGLPRYARNDELNLNLLPAVEQFNRLWAKWVQGKLQQVNVVVHKTTMCFKGLDFAVDSARLLYKPDLENAKSVALDASYLYSMYSGVNGYSVIVNGAEVVYQLYSEEYQKAFNIGAATLNAMALPYILAMCNRPYLGLAYGVWVAASTAYNAVLNAYSFALELKGKDSDLKSEKLAEWMTTSPLQKEYKLEEEKTEQSEFEPKVYLPDIIEGDGLKDVISGAMTEDF